MLKWAQKWFARMDKKPARTVEELTHEALRIGQAHRESFHHPDAILEMFVTKAEYEALEDELRMLGYRIDTENRKLYPELMGVRLIVEE